MRPFQEEDISDRYLGWLNDPEVNRYLDVRFVPQTYETVLPYVRSFYSNSERYFWGIHSNDDTAIIGTATLVNIQREHGTAGLGLMIGQRDYWGSGASAEAIELITGFAFDTLGLRRIGAETRAPNHGMNFTFKRLGFTLEGKRRQAFYIPPGEYVDQYSWGILADEWRAQHLNDG